MLKRILPLTLSACLGAAAAPAALAQSPITEQEAHAIAVDAYVYFYPLLSMEITRRQFTNVAPVTYPNTHLRTSRASFDRTSTRCTPVRGWTCRKNPS